jgi:hypothetical protein
MNTLAPYLAHTGITKDELGVYHLTMRTKEGADAIKAVSEKKGIKVVVTIVPPRKYFANTKARLEYMLSSNQMFKEFYDTLGLQLIE